MAMTWPWARAASLCSRIRSWMILSESGPRSTTSPVWTRMASPPLQRPCRRPAWRHARYPARRKNRHAGRRPQRCGARGLRCGRYEQGQGRHQPGKARPKSPQMRPLFDTFSLGRVLSNFWLSCKHCRRPWGPVTGMLKIMIIRHAEKHQHGSHDRGVNEDGRPAHHELTVRGWQRAGALVHLFAPPGGLPDVCQDSNAPLDFRLGRHQGQSQPAGDAHGRAAGRRLGASRSIMIMRKTKRRRWRRRWLTAPSPVADRLAPWRHSAAGEGNRRQAAGLSRSLAR